MNEGHATGEQGDTVTPALLAQRMERVAEQVYWMFFRAEMGARVHAFIEFCGVLKKYVEICSRCADEGIDFTQFNTHTGQALPVEAHDMEYLGEKLRCIFGPIIDSNPAARAALKRALFGSEPEPFLRRTLEAARGEITRLSTDGGGFACEVVDDIDAALAAVAGRSP